MSITGWALNNWSLCTAVAGGAAALGAGGILALSNIGEDSTTHLFRSVYDRKDPRLPWSQVLDRRKFSELPLVPRPYARLLAGDTGYNGGNYIIYYGSSACPHCTGFLYNNMNLAHNGGPSHSQNLMSNGAWMRAYAFTKEEPSLSALNIKFLMYDDVPDPQMVNKSDEYWTLPWSRWDYTDRSRGIMEGQYKRNDRSAKEIRRIIDHAQSVFGAERVPGTPTVIAYKKGKAAVFNKDSIKGLENDQKQEEDISSEDSLKRFIRHYYTSSEA